MHIDLNKIYCADALKGLKRLADKSVQCIITSPPYWKLRDYGIRGQLGWEDTPLQYVNRLIRIFKECHRVLADDGTLWLNIADTFYDPRKGSPKLKKLYKPKDLIGIPWMVAFAMRKAGWYIRDENIWHKPNPMPESIKDRCTRAHEFVFMFSKSAKYYYNADAIKTPAKPHSKAESHFSDGTKKSTHIRQRGEKQRGHSRRHNGFNERWDKMTLAEQTANGANKRSVWVVATKPFPEAHFATFPPELIIDCIKAGCPEGGGNSGSFHGCRHYCLSRCKVEPAVHRI